MEFSDLALAKLLQSVPEVGSLIVNFSEVSDQLEDAGVQVGVFLIQTGRGPGLIPVIGKGDTIFPIDSVFLQNESAFIPLTKNTISSLMAGDAVSYGKVGKIPDTVNRNPSVYSLINPPRTGKYVYATSSRLTEFLAMIPHHLQAQVFEKVAAEQSLYKVLDQHFGLKALVDALKNNAPKGSPTNSGSTGPSKLSQSPVSVITSAREVADLGDAALAKEFLNKGFIVSGEPEFTRVAIQYQPYNHIGQFQAVSPVADGGRDYTAVMKNGSTKQVYVPKYSPLNKARDHDQLVSVFTDGSYARGSILTTGSEWAGEDVLKLLFEFSPPCLLRDLGRDDKFLVFLTDGTALGPFTAESVTLTNRGTELKVYSPTAYSKILAYNNFTKEADAVGDTLFLASNCIVLPLGSDETYEVEISVNRAADLKEMIAAQFLGSQLDLRFDGIEFSVGGASKGSLANTLKYLVEQEHLDPLPAQNFLKQAQETKHVRLYLTKEATSTDINPAEIPQYGTTMPEARKPAINGSLAPDFTSNLQEASKVNDAQVMEASVISQLLEVPDLFEYINEYLPEIDESVNKLGRLLFLLRVKIDQLAMTMDSDSVFALVSQVKNVYKQLGESAIKLKGIASASMGFDPKQDVRQTNGE